MTASNIRTATPEDAATMSAIHETCFPDPWDDRAMAEILAMPGTYGLIDHETSGFIMMRVMADEAEILTIAVAPDCRRQGLARGLLAAGAAVAVGAGAGRIHLEVAEDNAPARAFYDSLGFQETGRRAGYYRLGRAAPADALNLTLEMADSGA